MNKLANELYEFGPFLIDPREHLLLRDREPLALTPKAFETLVVLIRNSGHLMLKEELMKAVWPDSFVEEVNLSQNISLLRKALGDSVQGSRYIVTVPGKGYRFVGQVKSVAPDAESDERVIVESHSRSRILIEESDVEENLDRVVQWPIAPRPELIALPAPAGTKFWSRTRTVGLVLAALALGIFAVWTLLPSPMPKLLRSVQLTHVGRVEPFGRVLTDGSRIYFTERLGGARALAQITEPIASPSLIATSVSGMVLYDIDRTRSKLLVAAQRPIDNSLDPLWEVSTTGGSARRFGDVLAGDAAWAPDETSLVYSREGELWTVDRDGQHSRKMFTAPGLVLYPRWAPDGRSVNFTVRDSAGRFSLWEIARDGGNPHRLTFGWKDASARYNDGECCGDWTSDGKYFVFRSMRDNVRSFWLIRARAAWYSRATPAPIQIYSTPDWISEPRFSADGRRILFVDYQDRRELVRYDAERKLFAPYLGGIPARHVNFSHDGRWVVYKNETDGNLWRSRADGSQALQLTFPPLEALHSTWSPDGKKIAFQGNGSLYVVPFDGGNPELLVSGSQPSWSPDGRFILFTRWAPSETGGLYPAIYQLELASRKVTVLPGSQDFEGPRCSPDGRYAVASDRKDQKLMLFDFSSQRWSELADGLPYGWGIRWSTDSRYVYYQHIYSGQEQPIFRVRVSDHRVEQITSARQILRADVLSYTLTGLTPDGSPLASLVHTNSDVYALDLQLP